MLYRDSFVKGAGPAAAGETGRFGGKGSGVMQPAFTNFTVMDRETCREFLALTWGKNAGVMRIVLAAVGAFSIGYGLWQFLARRSDFGYFAGMALMGLVALFLGMLGYLLRLPGYIRRQQKQWGGDTLEKRVEFYPERFVQHSRLGMLDFAYKDVTRVRTGRKTVLILMGSGALLMRKDGFGKNDWREFLRFLEGKVKT